MHATTRNCSFYINQFYQPPPSPKYGLSPGSRRDLLAHCLERLGNMRKVIQVVVDLRRKPSPEHIPVAANKLSHVSETQRVGMGKGGQRPSTHAKMGTTVWCFEASSPNQNGFRSFRSLVEKVDGAGRGNSTFTCSTRVQSDRCNARVSQQSV